jgi:hypothetical protein
VDEFDANRRTAQNNCAGQQRRRERQRTFAAQDSGYQFEDEPRRSWVSLFAPRSTTFPKRNTRSALPPRTLVRSDETVEAQPPRRLALLRDLRPAAVATSPSFQAASTSSRIQHHRSPDRPRYLGDCEANNMKSGVLPTIQERYRADVFVLTRA